MAETQGKYANALRLVRDPADSVHQAANKLGISSPRLYRRLTPIGSEGDIQALVQAGDQPIPAMRQAVSTFSV